MNVENICCCWFKSAVDDVGAINSVVQCFFVVTKVEVSIPFSKNYVNFYLPITINVGALANKKFRRKFVAENQTFIVRRLIKSKFSACLISPLSASTSNFRIPRNVLHLRDHFIVFIIQALLFRVLQDHFVNSSQTRDWSADGLVGHQIANIIDGHMVSISVVFIILYNTSKVTGDSFVKISNVERV